MTIKRWTAATTICIGLATLSACNEKGLSYGDPNSIIAVMALVEWDVVSEDVYDAFEKTITTVRDEKTFTVTYQEPYGEHWMNLRRFRQMLVIGTRDDEFVQEVLAETDEPPAADGAHQIYDVWSRGQTVTLVLMPSGWTASDLNPVLAEVHRLLDGQYRAYAQNRMYFSGVDSALADTLSTEHGFTLQMPKVYRWRQLDSVFQFRNDNPDPSELIREFNVTWLSPAATSLSTDAMLAWRETLSAEYMATEQDFALEGLLEQEFTQDGHTARQVQAQWRNPPELGWPAGGPFIMRAVNCEEQDRTYVIDAWLYAPGKEKYEYMIQLETILDSFACVT